ncbi:MAG: Rne/Rng family ribonuclease [Muribaculaceae bacterium]
MKSELIVDVQASEVSSALLEDSRLVSLQKEARNIAYAVGDIYLAKVKKLMPGLNAAFVNVGYEKDAFLHYLDLGPHFSTYSDFLTQLFEDKKRLPSVSRMKIQPEIDKHGSVADVLTPGRELMVQIVKEPISSKGPRLTTEISFTGRYLVLTPFNDKISISQKIKSTEEKMRLRQLVESIKPKNFGVIIRTSAEGKRVAELNHELKTLVQYWEDAVAKAQKAEAPSLIFEEESRIVGVLRDVFNPSFENIYVNDQQVYGQILNYVTLIAPERKDIVKLYSKDEPIFDHFGITRQIKSSFGKTVSFRSGAYIIIEHTEALHVIDVNSGNRTKATNDQESNALEVNLRAADEIARQLRLRDMGGIIVVDFIDMNRSEHRQQLYDHMREIMANDRARHNILPLSKFGLMQITRQRVRPALDITTSEECPSCFGKGEVQPSILFTDRLYEKLEYLVNELKARDFIMYIHPFVDAYIKRGLFSSLYRTWRRKLGRTFKVMPDESLAYLQFRVLDKDRNEISLRDEKDVSASSTEKTRNKARNRGGADDKSDDSKQVKTQPKSQQAQTQKQDKPKQQAQSAKPQNNQPKAEPKQAQQPRPARKDVQPQEADAVRDAKEERTQIVDKPDAEDKLPVSGSARLIAADAADPIAEAVVVKAEEVQPEEIAAEAEMCDAPDVPVETAEVQKKRSRRRRGGSKAAVAESVADESAAEAVDAVSDSETPAEADSSSADADIESGPDSEAEVTAAAAVQRRKPRRRKPRNKELPAAADGEQQLLLPIAELQEKPDFQTIEKSQDIMEDMQS